MGSCRVLTGFLDGCFSYGANSVWGSCDYSRLLLRASAHSTYVETVKAEGLPDADSLHRRIAMMDRDFHEAFLNLTEPCLKGLKHRGVILMVDVTYEPFYGCSGSPYIHLYRPVRGCVGCFEYLTASILMDERRFFIDALPLHRLASKAMLLEKLLSRVRALGVRVGAVLLDRGFASGDVIALLKRLRLRYLIHFPRNQRVKAILAEMGSSHYWRGRFTVKDVETTLIIVRDNGFDWVFATNMTFSEAAESIRLYRQRWNIETSHRCKGEARIKTKSLLLAVRYFLILVALTLYNLWKLLPERPPFKRLLINLDDMESADPWKLPSPSSCPYHSYDLPTTATSHLPST
jgi:hypothetical protein